MFLTLIIGTLLVITVFIDIRKAVIPNWCVLVILGIQVFRGIVSRPYLDAADRICRLLTRCAVILFLLFLLYIFFSIGAIGAGDLKLLAVTAVGFERPAVFVAVTFIIAAVLSLVQAIRKHNLISRIKYLNDYVEDLIGTRHIRGYFDANVKIENRKEYSIYFSIPILTAYVLMELFPVMIYFGG